MTQLLFLTTKTRKSLFVEGTVADVVPMFLKHPSKQIMESYIHKIPSSNQAKAKEEIELVRKTVHDFLCESENRNQHNTFCLTQNLLKLQCKGF